MKLPIFSAAAVGALIAAAVPHEPARGHGGGLNSEGCHNNRKTGDYHCHRGGGSSAKSASASKTLRALSGYSGGAFRNCSAARAAGAAPVKVGHPGYGAHLDRDNDGVGCE
jgi:hypothetical protein